MTDRFAKLEREAHAMLDFMRYMNYMHNCERDLIEWRKSRPLRFVTERGVELVSHAPLFREENNGDNRIR